jgi:hypothetical protein
MPANDQTPANPELTTPSIVGFVRWKKSYGHPLLTDRELTTAFLDTHGSSHATSLCVGIVIQAFVAFPDPTSTFGEPRCNLLKPIPEARFDCDAGRSSGDQFELAYTVFDLPLDKPIYVSVRPTEPGEREWVGDPNVWVRRFDPVDSPDVAHGPASEFCPSLGWMVRPLTKDDFRAYVDWEMWVAYYPRQGRHVLVDEGAG